MSSKLISNFSGGMNSSVNPILMKDSQSELIINYKLDNVGSLTKRNGYAVFASQPASGKTILGLHQYTNISTPAETTQVMVANNAGDTNAVIYYNNAGTWTASKSNDTAVATPTNFNRSRFAVFLDYLFRVNGVDAVATSNNVNGGVWGTTYAPAVITPTFISVFQDRVYVARNGVTNGSRVYFSSLPTVGGAITWDTANDWFNVNPDDGDEITALENNGSKLLIFKNRALYRWDFGYTEPDRLIGIGTSSQESVKTNLDMGITFFANPKGVYAYSGKRPRLLSKKIQPWIDSVTEWGNVVGEVDADHYYLFLGDSTIVSCPRMGGSKEYFNVMAVYTISLDAWTIYLLGTSWKTANKLIVSGVEGIYFGNTRGRTYQWDTGLADYSGGITYNSAQNISSEATKEVLLSFPAVQKVDKIGALSCNALQTELSYKTNNDKDFISKGNLIKEYFLSGSIGKEASSVRLKVSDNAQIQSKIDGLYVEYSPTEKTI